MNTFEISLDLDKGHQRLNGPIPIRQGDKRGTTVRATVYDHGVLLSGTHTARISMRLPTSANEYYRETGTWSNGVCTVIIDETYAAKYTGATEAYIEILDGSTVKASTQGFQVIVLPDAAADAVVAPPYDSAIEDALAELDEATGRISQMVQDATAEYLEAHPEITTTVQDNSLDDDKLIQKGGILQREQWLESLVPVLKGITKETPEADVHSVTDSAGGGPLGIEVYGRSTQDGTPTPDAPVPIESVEPYNLASYLGHLAPDASGVVFESTLYDGYVVPVIQGKYYACGNRIPVLAFYTSMPAVGSQSYNLSRTVDAQEIFVAPVTGYALLRYSAGQQNIVVTSGRGIPFYLPAGNVALMGAGRNLAMHKNQTASLNGVTFTYNSDGSITISGTATAAIYLWMNSQGRLLPNGTYTMSVSGLPSGNAMQVQFAHIAVGASTLTYDYSSTTDGSMTFTLPDNTMNDWRFVIPNGTTVNMTVKVQIEVGSVVHAYQPYESVTIPIDLGGRSLRSLPDGTRDEVNVDEWGHAVLTQRVGELTPQGESPIWSVRESDGRIVVRVPGIKPTAGNNEASPSLSDRFVFKSLNAAAAGDAAVWPNETGDRARVALNTGASGISSIPAAAAWLAENPVTLVYPLAEPVTIDLGYLDPALLPAPDLTAYVVPSAPSMLRYGFDVAAAIAEIVTS